MIELKPTSHAIPTATYRLQLQSQLRFEVAAKLAPYLSKLGIGAAYASPFLHACQGSTHGYDVVDHGHVDPALGTEDELGQLAGALAAEGLGLVADIVPNHMGISDPHNGWWQDVLVNGPASAYAHYFDIDWNPPKVALRNRVLLPVLGDQFGRVLEDQQLKLAYEGQQFVIEYYERRFPTDPNTWVPILQLALAEVSTELGPEVPDRMELESIITALEHVPTRAQLDAESIQERYRENEVAARRLSTLQEASAEIRRAVERAIVTFNGEKGDPASFDRLETLLTDQPYRLCYWRVATDEINYRRFFDIDSLAAIRVEDSEVFDAVHRAMLDYVGRGWVTGLRIDHADGLLDPQQYLTHLAEAVARARSESHPLPAGDDGSLYTIVEKILAHDEQLPTDWPIDGTTGYEFLNLLNDSFVDRGGAYALRDEYVRLTGIGDAFSEILYDSKRAILTGSLSSEMYMLSHQLDRISEHHRWSRRLHASVALSRTARSRDRLSGVSHVHPARQSRGERQ